MASTSACRRATAAWQKAACCRPPVSWQFRWRFSSWLAQPTDSQAESTALGLLGVAALAIVTAIGTYERSAIVGLIVLGVYMWMRTQAQSLALASFLPLLRCLLIYTSSSAWNARVSTIGAISKRQLGLCPDPGMEMDPGLHRHASVGGWVSDLPYRSCGTYPAAGPDPGHTEFGRAFHSIYFEVLGEHGYPGIVMFLLLAGSTFLMLRRICQRARRYAGLEWVVGLSDALQSGLPCSLRAGHSLGSPSSRCSGILLRWRICLLTLICGGWSMRRYSRCRPACGSTVSERYFNRPS